MKQKEMNMKKILLVVIVVSVMGSAFGGGVFVTGNGTGDVVISLESRETILAAIFLAENHTQEGVIARNLIIKGEGGPLRTIAENAFAGLTSIGGDLVLSDAAGADYADSQNTLLATINDAAFPDLVSVTGSIFCSGCAVTSLVFPILTSVGQDFRIFSNDDLEALSLPVLTSVGGDLGAYENDSLTTLSFPVLTSVVNDFKTYGDPQLATLSLPSLTSVGGDFRAYDNTALTTLSAPLLTSVGAGLYISNNPTLETIPFDIFDEVGGNVDCGTTAPSLFVNNIAGATDRNRLGLAGGIPAPEAATILRRNAHVTINRPGKSRSLNTHISTNYDNGDGTYSQKKHSLLGKAITS